MLGDVGDMLVRDEKPDDKDHIRLLASDTVEAKEEFRWIDSVSYAGGKLSCDCLLGVTSTASLLEE